MINEIANFEHFLIYLSGAMQFADDNGRVWRSEVKDKMVRIGIPANQIIDPTNKPITSFYGQDLDAQFQELDKLRCEQRWSQVERLAKNTIRVDLRCVDISSLIYCHIDLSTPTFGTMDEISVARTQRKPVILVVPGGIDNCPYWLIGRCGKDSIFPNDDSAILYLNDVIHGNCSFNAKSWLFFGSC